MSNTADPSTVECVAGENARLVAARFKSRVFAFGCVATPVGVLALAATDRGLCACEFDEDPVNPPFEGDPRDLLRPGALDAIARTHVAAAVTQLREYLAGSRREFTLQLDTDLLKPTPFTRACWSHLDTIPYGATRSYGEVARALGDAKASRAVGGANSRNPICIIRPCHRVIGADGSLTGFASGIERKRWLLEHEQHHKPNASQSLFASATSETP